MRLIYNDIPGFLSKDSPLWHKKVYGMWRGMWSRVYHNIYYFGSLIHPDFKYLSNYVKWIESQPRFEEFCSTCHNTRWNIDKDKHGNKNYYPEFMTLCLDSDNSIEVNTRCNNVKRLHTKESQDKATRSRWKPIIGISLDNKDILLFLSIKHAKVKGFHHAIINDCLKGKFKQHKGYKWKYINYKHEKRLRKTSS